MLKVNPRRTLFTACLAGGMLASGSVVILAVLDRGGVEIPTAFAVGSLWGQVVGVVAFLVAGKVGEDRRRPVHPLHGAVFAAGMAAATSALPYGVSLCLMCAGF